MLALILAALTPLAGGFTPAPKLLRAVSHHFELYTTNNEAAASAALEHFETVRGYLLRATGGQDPFPQPVRIVGFKSRGEYSSHLLRTVEGGRSFSVTRAGRTTIVMAALKKDQYE